jgi:hypothetical protein
MPRAKKRKTSTVPDDELLKLKQVFEKIKDYDKKHEISQSLENVMYEIFMNEVQNPQEFMIDYFIKKSGVDLEQLVLNERLILQKNMEIQDYYIKIGLLANRSNESAMNQGKR